jgi:membrane associated rhomboid family serine protease
MPQCVDCGQETPREEMFGPPDELRCRACVERRFPTTNVPTRHRSSFFLRWPPVTMFVIITAVGVTLLYYSNVEEVEWLMADDVPIWRGQLWRLLTTVFPHARVSLLHILFNAMWIWYLGKGVENWMGALRYAGFFIASAVGSSAAEFLVMGQGGIGLSGVVYALFGLLYVLRREEEFAAELMPPRTIQLFVIWFFICIGLTYAHILNVGNVAHGSGAVIGWLFGQAILAHRRVLAIAATGLFCVALCLTTLYMPWNGRYDWYRGDVCYSKQDYASAVIWYRRAAERLTDEDRETVLGNVRAAENELRIEHKDGD